ncbi:MAG: CBS domain-containing protein [Candidatus Omnitrophica bacterium]|nr:CBS domain-containing protein [Candidatus Omnitrophota bacterium]
MSDQFFVYFSELLGRPVFSVDGKKLGRFSDFALNLNNDIYLRAKGVVVRRGLWHPQYVELPMAELLKVDRGGIYFKLAAEAVVFTAGKPDCEFALRRDVLDQQIVDVENRKVERVNDVHLLRVDNQYHVAHVDVGLRGLIRRLEWEGFVDFLVRLFKKDAAYLSAEDLLSWKNSQVLTLGSKKNVLKLDVARAKLAMIPPTVLAEIMGDLDVFEQASLYRSLAPDVGRKMFADMAPDDKRGLIDQLEDAEAAQLVSQIPSDEAADFLMSLPKERMHHLLRLMESQSSRRLRTLLGFHKDSAGGLMATEYLWLRKDATVRDAWDKLKTSSEFTASLTTIYVVDEFFNYVGTTTIRRFISEPPEKPILEVCHPHKVFVRTDDGMEEVALLLEQYKYSAIPVLDGNGVLMGSITVDDVMEALIALAWGKYKDQI